MALAFTSYFERARSLDLLLAQKPDLAPPAGQVIDNAEANRGLTYLQDLYPGAIGEACLSNDRGVEVGRVTHGIAAPVAELATNEATNPFFAPTLALGPGQVYQATPYVSQDTRRRVISNSTWIRQANGSRLIVHFEVDLESFRQYLTTSTTSRHVAVVDQATGRVALEDGVRLPATDPEDSFPIFGSRAALLSGAGAGAAPAVNAAGQRLARSSVTHTRANANDWVIVEWSTARASLIPSWVGLGAVAIGVGLIAFFLVVVRSQQGALRRVALLDHLTGLSNRKAPRGVPARGRGRGGRAVRPAGRGADDRPGRVQAGQRHPWARQG